MVSGFMVEWALDLERLMGLGCGFCLTQSSEAAKGWGGLVEGLLVEGWRGLVIGEVADDAVESVFEKGGVEVDEEG